MKLLPFLLLLSIGMNAQDKPDTLTASPKEKVLFSLNFRRMNECCTAVLVQRKEIAEMDTLLNLYMKESKIYQTNIQLAKESFDLRNSINQECLPQLTECQKSLDIYRPRAMNRGLIICIGFPVVAVGGYGLGRFVQSIK